MGALEQGAPCGAPLALCPFYFIHADGQPLLKEHSNFPHNERSKPMPTTTLSEKQRHLVLCGRIPAIPPPGALATVKGRRPSKVAWGFSVMVGSTQDFRVSPSLPAPVRIEMDQLRSIPQEQSCETDTNRFATIGFVTCRGSRNFGRFAPHQQHEKKARLAGRI